MTGIHEYRVPNPKTFPGCANRQYVHILFRSNALFLLLGPILVPIGITLDVRAAGFMAPFILFFGWHWGIMAGTIFGVALIVAANRLPILSSFTQRRQWFVIGALLGLIAGALVSAVAGVDMLREIASLPGNHNDPVQMLLRIIIIPSAICGCLCAGLVLYPNDLTVLNSSRKIVWTWIDMLWALPILCLIILKIVVLFHNQ